MIEGVKDNAIFTLDTEGRIASWNLGAQRFQGYTAGEIVGKHFSTFYPPDSVAAGLPHELLEEARTQGQVRDEGWRVRKDGTRFFADVAIAAIRDKSGQLCGFAKVTRDVTKQKRNDEEREKIIAELQSVLGQVKTLSGLIPICGWCKSVRSDAGYWQSVEQYVLAHSAANFSHGMCPDCATKFRADLAKTKSASTVPSV
jgi:PAS domain S-box-containing protein